MKSDLIAAVKAAVIWVWEYSHATKTYDFYLSTLERLIKSVYDGNLGAEFMAIMDGLISKQISSAYEQAWTDDGNDPPMPDYLRFGSDTMIADQRSFVEQFYKEIYTAGVDKTGVDSFLARAPLWANRWNEAYADGSHLIALQNGNREIWQYGDTEHCPTCLSLNGIVAYASEWEASGFHPQSAPNDMLDCGGWNCGCSRIPTDARRSPKALDKLMSLAGR